MKIKISENKNKKKALIESKARFFSQMFSLKSSYQY